MIITFDQVNTLDSGKQHFVGKYIHCTLGAQVSAPSVNALLNSIDLKMAPPHRSVVKAGHKSCCPFSVRKGNKMFRNIQRNSGKLRSTYNVDDPSLSMVFLVQRQPDKFAR
ncbi:hypothetical protein PoB_002254800 [Plakobranchus ocellatus]|uniref:Uncharacterized protein n=1 Tax=Plakobranchus ocellatus TaxID=259542 RepID=A0AAV3ZN71_9GAST|nr:hypothetical protein PoB_002254800 [Plakobranchus ocellatus]